MVCYNPLAAYRRDGVLTPDEKTGELKRTVTILGSYLNLSPKNREFFDNPPAHMETLRLPCGTCPGCQLDRSRSWAARCMVESSLYEKNCFITLTFAPEHLKDNSLHKEDFVKFMKRLRKMYGKGIRFFHCGEYGSKRLRPHHHAILFNFDFPDKVLFKYDKERNITLWTSPSLSKLWPFGFSTVGECTFESCQYVARYVMKKQYGSETDYDKLGIIPEYITMSRMPGIANEWFKKYSADVYGVDRLVVSKSISIKPPRYFDKLYDDMCFDAMEKIREERKERHYGDIPLDSLRLNTMCNKKLLQSKKLVRKFEESL